MADEDRDQDDGVTRADLAELAGSLGELRQAFEDLRTATTAGERSSAREDVADVREDLDETAARLGISRATLDKSIKAAKDADRKEELRPILKELWDELRAADADDDSDDDDKPAPKKRKPRARAASSSTDDDTDDAQPVVDTDPVREHWSERGVGGMLR